MRIEPIERSWLKRFWDNLLNRPKPVKVVYIEGEDDIADQLAAFLDNPNFETKSIEKGKSDDESDQAGD